MIASCMFRRLFFTMWQLLVILWTAEARQRPHHAGGVWGSLRPALLDAANNVYDRPRRLFLVHARDGVSSRAAASVTLTQDGAACSGGSCSLTSSSSSTNMMSKNGNSTATSQAMRGGSTRTMPSPSEERSDLLAAVDAPVGNDVQNSSDVAGRHETAATATTGKPLPAEDSNDYAMDDEANAPGGEELSSKQVSTHHQETRKEKRQRLKRHKQIAKKLKNRNARNLRRKVLHACFGLTFAGLNHWLPKSTFVPCMALLSSATLVMELLRYRKGFGWMNAALHGILGQSLRKHEMEGKFTGSFYFFTGVTLTSWLFDSTSATLGICQLALADPSASYFGRKTRHIYWSRIENGFGGFGRNKGVLGFLGGALFCFPFNYRVLSVAAKHSKLAGLSVGSATAPVIVAASLALGVAGAFADLAVPTPALVLPKKILGVRVPPFHVDDNMVVPIFSAYACREIFRVLQLGQLELSRWVVI